jgi:hypothetical protein
MRRANPLVLPESGKETLGQAAKRSCLICNGAYIDKRGQA